VSEYRLYGRFVRDVLGTSGGQFVSASPLCMDYYKCTPLTVPELTTFLDGAGYEAIAVSLNSKAGMKTGDYVEMLERQWAAPEGDDEVRANKSACPCRRAGIHTTVAGSRAREAGEGQPGRFASTTAPARDAPSPPRSGRRAGALAGLMMVLIGLGLD